MHTVEHPLRVFVLCITSLVLVFVSEATAQQQRPAIQAMSTSPVADMMLMPPIAISTATKTPESVGPTLNLSCPMRQ